MKKYYIEWGVAGGFGGISAAEIIECGSMEDAEKEAWLRSCEQYDGYAGRHGLRSIEQIMEEDELDESEAEQEYNEERESWLDYSAEEYAPEIHDRKIEMYS